MLKKGPWKNKSKKTKSESYMHVKDGTCYLCMKRAPVQKHHIYPGSRRQASEKAGAYVWLCPDCHTMGPHAVHRDPEVMKDLQRTAQWIYEETHTREEFIKTFGKSYI